MAALPTRSFVLSSVVPTQVSPPNPNGRRYVLISNNDKQNAVAFAHGTANQASPLHHIIGPGSYFEWAWPAPFGGFLPESLWGLTLDISMIALSGNPVIAYTES